MAARSRHTPACRNCFFLPSTCSSSREARHHRRQLTLQRRGLMAPSLPLFPRSPRCNVTMTDSAPVAGPSAVPRNGEFRSRNDQIALIAKYIAEPAQFNVIYAKWLAGSWVPRSCQDWHGFTIPHGRTSPERLARRIASGPAICSIAWALVRRSNSLNAGL